MIKIDNTQVFGWEAAIRGMRNPMNSWEKSDSDWVSVYTRTPHGYNTYRYLVGTNDHDLMMRLVKAGDEHAKFMRMIHVSMDILAPLYWWKQADTYKVGFVTNSCSTMHKIHAKEFTTLDFSDDHLLNGRHGKVLDSDGNDITMAPNELLGHVICHLNIYRELYLKTRDKTYWWQMIQLLPDSYNQLRTCDTNYATLRKMYHQRKGHKLDEWREFCDWIRGLPNSELITGED